jgi:hypothetical protein
MGIRINEQGLLERRFADQEILHTRDHLVPRADPIPSSSAGRMERGLEFLDEFLQLFRIDVADGKELETLCTPALDVETLHGLGSRPVTFGGTSLRDEEIDHMRAAPIDDRRDGLAVDVVEPSAEQREALRRQVHDGRCDIDLAVEPWFHRMLVVRLHVGEVVALKRAHMRRRHVAKHALVLIRSK